MAYIRGDNYIWSDEDHLHIWSADGYDSWDTTAWHREAEYDSHGEPTGEDFIRPEHLQDGKSIASGVSIPQEVIDEYVMMRLAQLIFEGNALSAIDRALDPAIRGGNTGGEVLKKNAERLKDALRSLSFEAAPPYAWPEFENSTSQT